MERLPQELLDAILENLDFDSLNISSLVCRSFLPSSQRLLFRKLRLIINGSGPQHDPTAGPRIQLFLDSPHLADYVHELKVIRLNFPWTPIENNFVLPKFNHVQSLKLYLYNIPWFRFPQNIRQAFHRVLHLSSMKSLQLGEVSFGNVEELESVLYHAQCVTHLCLSKVDFCEVTKENLIEQDKEEEEEAEEDHGIGLRKQRRLSYLRLDFVYPFHIFVNWLVGPSSLFDVSYIHTLQLFDDSWYGDDINHLLHAIGSSLQNFQLYLPPYKEVTSRSLVDIDMTFNPHIKHLHLTEFNVNRMSLDQLPWLVRFLSITHTSNRIEEITLEVNVHYQDLIDFSPWKEVDCILAGPRFKFLKKFNLIVSMRAFGYFEGGQSIWAMFPKLRERGILA